MHPKEIDDSPDLQPEEITMPKLYSFEDLKKSQAWFLMEVHNSEFTQSFATPETFAYIYSMDFLPTYTANDPDPHDYSFENQPIHAQKWVDWAKSVGYIPKSAGSSSAYSPPPPPPNPALVTTSIASDWKPRTQKARGIQLLDSINGLHNFKRNKHVFVPAAHVFADGDTFNFPLFARPCPIRPRHGFVDSREVRNRADVDLIMQETFAADPEAEVAFCKKINATHSAILTDGLLVIGPNHDGATNGHEGCVEFPVINMTLTGKAIDKAVVADTEAPFWELVYSNYNPATVVQLRSGPKVNYNSVDYIPADLVVTRLYDSRNVTDLLAWEQAIENAPAGSVIYASTMACHFAIHGIVNNVPVVTSRVPVLGETLLKNSDVVKPLDKGEFAVGFATAFEAVVDECIHAVLSRWLDFVLATMHNSTALLALGRAYEIGMAAGLFVRIVHTLAAGEMRLYKGDGGKPTGSRDEVYEEYAMIGLDEVGDNLATFYSKFHQSCWVGGYGGPAWGGVTKGGADVFNAALLSPEKTLAELNIAVNLCHNGGWFMNKFANKSVMDKAAANPVAFAAMVGPNIYRILRTARVAAAVLEKIDIKAVVQKIAPESVVKKKVVSAQIRHLEGDMYRLQIMYSDGSYTEVDLCASQLTKQAPKTIAAGTPSKKSYYQSSAQYIPCDILGKGSKWFGVFGFRIFSFKALSAIQGYINC